MKTNSKIFIYFSIFSLNVSTILSFNINFNKLSEYLDEEKAIIDAFEEYLISEENRIKHLRQTYERFRQQNTIALKDKDLFLSHPNDVYFLIKRITIEWKNVDEMLEPIRTIKNKFISKINTIDSKKYYFEDAVKLYESITNYYKLNITSAANGLIMAQNMTSSGGLKVLKSLSDQTFDAFDCHSIGEQSLKIWNYLSAVQWFDETLKRSDNISRDQFKSNIFKSISLSMFKTQELDPLNLDFETKINEMKSLSDVSPFAKFTFDIMASMNKSEQEQLKIKPHPRNYTKELFERTADLCRGQKLMNISYESKLKCFYLNTTLRPYLRLTRVRVEELYKRSQIVLIHNFLSETEAQTLKNISTPRLYRGKVVNSTGHEYVSQIKIADNAGISLLNTSVVELLDRRISEITRLKTEHDYHYTVTRYNVGGLFKLHHDGGNENITHTRIGRIANYMIYLDDKVVGGATAFPKYNVSVFPQKYSALLWFNIFGSGDINLDADHMGCPVTFGRKWTTIKFFYVKDQTFDKCSNNNRYEKRTL